jgi:predicted Zn-ribbon and HTH transcriptional regulator
LRTVKEFVADMLEMGRTPEQIRNVAAASRWSDKTKEVAEEVKLQTKSDKRKAKK